MPADNPFGNAVWSYGHRNVQGLAFDTDGRLWASEFGQQEYDELNVIQRGGNYGWPRIEGPGDEAGFVAPVVTWAPDEHGVNPRASRGPGTPSWWRPSPGSACSLVPVDGGQAGQPRPALTDDGRLRTVAAAPDGTVWVMTSNTDGRADPREGDDRILRVPLESG